MTLEDIEIKTKLDSIAWTVYRINRDTSSYDVNFAMSNSQISVLFFESDLQTRSFLIGRDDPHLIDRLDECERFLLKMLRTRNNRRVR